MYIYHLSARKQDRMACRAVSEKHVAFECNTNTEAFVHAACRDCRYGVGSGVQLVRQYTYTRTHEHIRTQFLYAYTHRHTDTQTHRHTHTHTHTCECNLWTLVFSYSNHLLNKVKWYRHTHKKNKVKWYRRKNKNPKGNHACTYLSVYGMHWYKGNVSFTLKPRTHYLEALIHYERITLRH